MNEVVAPKDIRSGDTVILPHSSFVVQNVTRMPMARGVAYWIFREPDGKLVFSAHEGEGITRKKPSRRRPRKTTSAPAV